jgi:hypothetical protein
MFFTVANPGIENSGAFLTSKHEIYKQFNEEHIPKTLLVNEKSRIEDYTQFIAHNELNYPLIAKPDYGLRGLGISMIRTEKQLSNLQSEINQDYILQEFIDYKNEIGVFLIRQPRGEFKITSIVERQFIEVIGDGIKSIKEHILNVPRYAMQFDNLIDQEDIVIDRIPKVGEIIDFDKIGNHSKGTIFKDGNYLISDKLTQVMNEVLTDFNGFNYGRLDIKYKSTEELLKGNHLKIIELNGVFSEPAHIYNPGNSIFAAWKDLLIHFKELVAVSKRSLNQGHIPLSFSGGLRKLKEHFQMTARMVEQFE